MPPGAKVDEAPGKDPAGAGRRPCRTATKAATPCPPAPGNQEPPGAPRSPQGADRGSRQRPQLLGRPRSDPPSGPDSSSEGQGSGARTYTS
ncbi:hypothetical protein NDU88_006739 [Pleurodeles waltl]|uniref:Uncharacterized protein n=1 Tax=Pleurodeles waltl TaxID=8319 RepID=A0AAV7U1A2_PLEWA|nr:hypothetical protein NDU88_006739 [Pleurodeles waltl]